MPETEIHVSQILPGIAYELIGTNSGATKDVYLTLSGTTHQVGVGTAGTTITLSTPQNIDTNSSVQFQQLTLGSVTPGGIVFNDTEGSPKSIILEAPTTVASSYTLLLPVAQGVADSFLKNDGSGNLSFNTIALGTDLSDVVIASPIVSQILTFNGADWINGNPVPASTGNGIEFFEDSAVIIAVSSNNANELNTLTRAPSGVAEDTVPVTCNNNTVLAEAHLYNTALNRTVLDAGVWDFDTWASVDSITGPGISQMLINTCRVRPVTDNTVTTSGSGTSRTALATGGSYFNTIDCTASGTNTVASYLQTSQGLYQITARTNDNQVTISTPSGYANESTVAFSVWKQLFSIATGSITNITPNYALFNTQTVQPSFSCVVTDKIGIFDFGTTTHTSNKIITHVQDGTAHYSHFASPLAILHNDLAGLQGGTGNQYYHLTNAEYTGTGSGAFVRDTAPSITTSLTLLNEASIQFQDTEGTPKAVTLEAPTTLTNSYTLKWPLDQASGTQVLANDGSGNLSWVSPSGIVSSGTQYQLGYYAIGGTTISGNSNITTNASSQLLVPNGSVSAPSYSLTNSTGSGMFLADATHNLLGLTSNGTMIIGVNSDLTRGALCTIGQGILPQSGTQPGELLNVFSNINGDFSSDIVCNNMGTGAARLLASADLVSSPNTCVAYVCANGSGFNETYYTALSRISTTAWIDQSANGRMNWNTTSPDVYHWSAATSNVHHWLHGADPTSDDATMTNGSLACAGIVLKNEASIQFQDTEGTPKAVTLEAPVTLTASYTLKLPLVQASGTQLLENDGSGNLSWVSAGSIPTYTDWTSFSPTFNGQGTPTNVAFFYRQMGANIEVRGNWTTGTVTGDTFYISNLPVAINLIHVPTTGGQTALFGTCMLLHPSGVGASNFGNADNVKLFTDGSDNAKIFGAIGYNGGGTFTKQTSSSTFYTNGYNACYFSYPV